MRLAKIQVRTGNQAVAILEGDQAKVLYGAVRLCDILHASDPAGAAQSADIETTLNADEFTLLAPIDEQEVWAAGVTYLRSKDARERESEGAARFYDLVYSADRPELFFKAPAYRVVGPGDSVRIRRDSRWNVPEPELAIVVSPSLKLVGFTIGNDMSSRDIEGENPLYLPQAKVYDGSCSLGPCIALASDMPTGDRLVIRLSIVRGNKEVFAGETSAAQIKRSFEELIGWLGRETSFPRGAILLTGTGIVPPDSFTLEPGDLTRIEIAGIGVLENRVIQRSE